MRPRSSQRNHRQLLSGFTTGLIAIIPALLGISALSGYFLSRRALAPVDRLTVAVRSISIGNLSGRLPIYETGDEIQRLAETSNEMLARLESAVSRIHRFTADASHELRSPISFIRTVAEYAIRNPKIDTESAVAFEEILEESESAGRLLDDMLTLARADAGQANVRFEPLELRDLIAEVCEKIRPLAKNRSQTLAWMGDAPCQINGDRASVGRLLWSLLDNAVKYTPPGGRIAVELRRAGPEARIAVSDTGIGIPEALQPRIFERFFRADPSRGEVDGTGLGLAIAKWIADAHHAKLSVESKVGQGTTIYVAFAASDHMAAY